MMREGALALHKDLTGEFPEQHRRVGSTTHYAVGHTRAGTQELRDGFTDHYAVSGRGDDLQAVSCERTSKRHEGSG